MKNMNLTIANQKLEGDSLRPLVQRVRSWAISRTAGLMSLVDKIHYANLAHPIGWKDHLRWWLDGKLTTVFGWAWAGSNEEIEAVLNGEAPLEYMSARQRAVLTKPRSEYGAHCCHCAWDGWWDECHGDHECPNCGEGVYLDPLNHAVNVRTPHPQ